MRGSGSAGRRKKDIKKELERTETDIIKSINKNICMQFEDVDVYNHRVEKLVESVKCITKQYKDINEDCQNNKKATEEMERYNLIGMLKNSPFTSYQDSAFFLQRFQICLHSLSYAWDNWIIENSDENKNSSHRFLLTYGTEKRDNEYEYIARIYNKELGPDRRLISIIVPRDNYHIDYMPILHEMGHYIGGRNRKKRVETIADFAWLYFMNQVYNRCKKHYNLPDQIPAENTQNPHERTTLARAKSITGYLSLLYKALNEYWASYTKSKSFSWEDRYAKEMVTNCITFLEEYLSGGNKDVFWEDIEKRIEESGIPIVYFGDDSKPETEIEPFTEENYNTIKNETISCIKNIMAKKQATMKEIVRYIEEPIADCFMICVGDLSAEEYLNYVLQHAWFAWVKAEDSALRNQETFRKYCARILMSRILPILVALAIGNDDRPGKYKSIASFGRKQKNICAAHNLIVDELNKTITEAQRRSSEIEQLMKERKKIYKKDKESLKSVNEKIQRTTVPEQFELDYQHYIFPLSNYIMNIMFQHKHYKEIKEAPDKAIQTIRLFNCKSDFFLRKRIKKHDSKKDSELYEDLTGYIF